MADLIGYHALITDSSRGIGYAIARSFIEQGASVTIAGKDAARLNKAKRELNAANALCFDVTNEAEMLEATSTINHLNLLINNAGAAHSAPFLKTRSQDLNEMLALNLIAPYTLTRALLPHLLEGAKVKRARIINIASTAGLIGYPYVSAYVAAKHGLIGFTKALALELAGKNITVNAIAPSFTKTDLIETALTNITAKTGRGREDVLSDLTKTNPMKRLVTPEEVAKAALFLCSEGSDMINGHTLTIDGGEVIA
jgi:NAD(P)-dependent dehydrogenase (short-subunit alcohol dehydrogenase family)